MKKKDCSMEEVMNLLKAPFPSKDIEWRVSRCGITNGKPWAMVLAYVTNRAIQNRLDEVFGPAGWKNDFRDFMQGILCTISCYVDGEWVSKSDGAEQTLFESLKGGLSSAMKRAAVQWGIGRYLYNLEETFVEVFSERRPGAIRIKDDKQKVYGYWIPPQLPDWALPENERTGMQSSSSSQSQNLNGRAQNQQQQRGNQNKQSQGFNRPGAVKAIQEYLKNTGLAEHPGWIMSLFKKINPTIKQNSLAEVFEKATEEEMKIYYSVLRPVNDLIVVANNYKVSLDDVLHYVQILCPTVKVENLFSCFTHVTTDHVREIVQMVKGDLKNGHIQQIA
ncbi:Rad52/Rad22 family DNA repair protein [Bacillus methanolicus]|uniref:Rad52/Rad22 family DNA repair protein n=1 Tax=Bacillus methanolicus TaxID=1471 RepID=UPI002380AB01|nr:Rad52/Rad22 family DNA repair protein [Bacillus methanolicus]